jgi:ribosomal protein L7/L12
MPNWGWLIVVLILVDLAVLTTWLLTRRSQSINKQSSPNARLAHLDLDTRDRVERLVADHKKVHAITVLRERTGLGLAAAKAAVDAVERGEWVPTSGNPPTDWHDLEPELRSLKADGQPVKAAKMLRDRTGMGLREAKETVDRL